MLHTKKKKNKKKNKKQKTKIKKQKTKIDIFFILGELVRFH